MNTTVLAEAYERCEAEGQMMLAIVLSSAVFVLKFIHIQIWVDAHANLPARARWIATADVAPSGATKRVKRRPSHELEGFFVFSVYHRSTNYPGLPGD